MIEFMVGVVIGAVFHKFWAQVWAWVKTTKVYFRVMEWVQGLKK